jgi:hypothetical protein
LKAADVTRFESTAVMQINLQVIDLLQRQIQLLIY